jgi:hypothetical protein
MPYGDKPFGLREIKLVKGATVVSLDAAIELKFKENMVGGRLRGNDSIKASVAFGDSVEWELSAGGIPLDGYAVMTGRTMTTTGTTPNRVTTGTFKAGDVMPYFKIYGKAMGPSGDDTHVKMVNCKLDADGLEGSFKDGEFVVTKCKGISLDLGDGSGYLQVVENETTAALPAT